MFFWKKENPPLVIRCSHCGWRPDGGNHWKCSCGHTWNTFHTKGKCPACKFQWEDTWCPACAKPSPHKSWYKTEEEWARLESLVDPVLLHRKKSLEARLVGYGITQTKISYLKYVDWPNTIPQSPFEAGSRMLILQALAWLAQNPEQKAEVYEWLMEEKLWSRTSPSERKFLLEDTAHEQVRINLSWHIEAAFTLAWCLNKVTQLPRLDADENDQVLEEYEARVPQIGDSTLLFLTSLEYRNLNEIYEEALLNELVTTYFRDLMFNGKRDTTNINRAISFERHLVLNWLRTEYLDGDQDPAQLWDDVDTST